MKEYQLNAIFEFDNVDELKDQLADIVLNFERGDRTGFGWEIEILAD